MNYKEKYEQAIAIAGELRKSGACDMLEVIERIFPELKENEDEKIRKIIKDFIVERYKRSSTIKGISEHQCLAWLEKQGEQEPTYKAKKIEEDKLIEMEKDYLRTIPKY